MPKRKIQSPKYTGELAAPIELTPRHKLSPPSSLFDPAYLDEAYKRWMKLSEKEGWEIAIERATKTLLLFKHHDIDPLHPDAGFKLAMKLAIAHVPGFQVVRPQKRGTKNKWDNSKLIDLWWQVTQKAKNKNRTASWACKELAKQEPWKSLLSGRKNGGSWERLYAVYEEALQNPFVRLAKIKVLNNSRLEATDRQTIIQELIADLKECAAQPPPPLPFDEKLTK